MLQKITMALAVLSLLTACASGPEGESVKGPFPAPTVPLPEKTTSQEITSYRVNDPEPPAVIDKELDAIPPEMQSKVELWISYFQGKGRPHMERYLARSTRYIKLMKLIMRQNGLPEDLVYIALIESGFSSHATSRAAAVGYWQFIKGTGRRYGLEINSFVDERRDPVLSTQAAAEYFKELYSAFGSWYLSMASYNVGENRVKREVIQTYTRDFWELARKRKLPKETANYVPKFIAARMIGNNPEKYGFSDIEYEKPQEFEVISVNKAISLRHMAEKMHLDYEEFKQLNPKYRGEIAPLKGNHVELRVPLGQSQLAMSAAQESVVDRVQFIADAGETDTYRVRPGDSLFTIARKYRTTVVWLRDVNELKSGKKLRVGMRIQVPDRNSRVGKKSRSESQAVVSKSQTPVASLAVIAKSSGPATMTTGATSPSPTPQVATELPEKLVATNETSAVVNATPSPAGPQIAATAPPSAGNPIEAIAGVASPVSAEIKADQEVANNAEIVTDQGVYYIVQTGDTLSSISEEYDSSISELRKMNKLSKGSVLKVGMKLKVPKDDGLPSEPESSPVSESEVNAALPTDSISHIVKAGESLEVIAKQYGVSVKEIQTANNLKKKSRILQGMTLLIPVKAKPGTSVIRRAQPSRKIASKMKKRVLGVRHVHPRKIARSKIKRRTRYVAQRSAKN